MLSRGERIMIGGNKCIYRGVDNGTEEVRV